MTQQPPGHRPIPTRHGADIATGRRLGRQVRWLTRGDPEPSPERWRALGEALLHGDPLMDAVVTWMLDIGVGEGRSIFQRALDEGIQRVPEAPDCLRVLRDAALMGGYQAAAINKTLVLTGSLSRGPQRRLAETTKWWLDCTTIGGMHRFAEGFKSTMHVRLIHGLIRHRVQRMPEWDITEWGLPVNQTDMAATQLGFSVVFLLGSRALGVPLTAGEGRAVMHLWRYVGWLMGVDERWLPETESEGRTLLYQILLSQAPPDESSRQLGFALMNEPFERHYPNLAWLRGHFERARHLSIARLFLDRQSMRDLGLPDRVLPWYPALAAPANLFHQGTRRLLPGGRHRLARQGRKAQVDYLTVLFGDAAPAIHQPS